MNAPAATATFEVLELTGIERCGIKGPAALTLLQGVAAPVPETANAVLRFAAPEAGRCLRLGRTEFILEQDDGAALMGRVAAAVAASTQAVALAPRSDRCFVLRGEGLFPALRRISNFDFESLGATPDIAVMTLLAGISVFFVPEPAQKGPALRLWSDPGFGDYLLECFASLGGRLAAPPTQHAPSLPSLKQGTPA